MKTKLVLRGTQALALLLSLAGLSVLAATAGLSLPHAASITREYLPDVLWIAVAVILLAVTSRGSAE